jgi:hypothetical protein
LVTVAVTPAQQRHIDRGLDRARVLGREQRREQRAVQPVHRVVLALQLPGGLHVPALDDLPDFPRQVDPDAPHLLERTAQLLRDYALRVAAAGDLGDVPGQVPHPLQVRAHSQRGHQGAQVPGDRLLTRDQIQCAHVQFLLQRVHRVVGGDHRLGQLEVRLHQRTGRALERGTDQRGHLHQGVPDRVELLVVHVAHQHPPLTVGIGSVHPIGAMQGLSQCPPPSYVAGVGTVRPHTHRGWSVIVTGYARLVTDPGEAARYQCLLEPWVEQSMDYAVRIRPDLVTGFRLH